jgi:hypothetical protein
VNIASTPELPIKLPQIRVSGDVGPDLSELVSLVDDARKAIRARYKDAARALEIAYLMRREQDRKLQREHEIQMRREQDQDDEETVSAFIDAYYTDIRSRLAALVARIK